MLQTRYLEAANWALQCEQEGKESGINIRRMPYNTGNVTLFNASKGLLYEGYSDPNQAFLKGLIVEEVDGKAVNILSACLSKFFNYGEPSEKEQYRQYIDSGNTHVIFFEKLDGTNIRPYFNPASNRVEFATRSMLTGSLDEDDENGYFDYGSAARKIAQEKYPILLDKGFVNKYSLVFELIHPKTKVITNYGNKEDLILLVGFNLEKDCRELEFMELNALASVYNFPLPYIYHHGKSDEDFYKLVDNVEKQWDGTDLEGTVAVFYHSETNSPLYRLKIKNKEYLQTLRIMKFCTLNRTRELIEEKGICSWEELRAYLYELPSMNEEIEMAYKVYYDKYESWCQSISDLIQDCKNKYNALPKFESQKDFALAILGNPEFKQHSALYFQLHKTNGVLDDDKVKNIVEKYIPFGSE